MVEIYPRGASDWKYAQGRHTTAQMAITAIATPFLVMFLDTKPRCGSTTQECCDFIIGLLNSRMSTGCKIITVSRESSTPLASTNPKS